MQKKYFSFRETANFTKRVVKLMSDDDFAELQMFLITEPNLGQVIPKSNGLRKIRWKSKQGGKRGGVRIIYYFVVKKDLILLLDIYSKKDKTNLTNDELKELAKIKDKELEI